MLFCCNIYITWIFTAIPSMPLSRDDDVGWSWIHSICDRYNLLVSNDNMYSRGQISACEDNKYWVFASNPHDDGNFLNYGSKIEQL